jgi:hypothetical protein
MADQEEDPAVPTDDPRQMGMAEGYPEENPEATTGGGDEGQGPERHADNPDAPSVSSDDEGDAGQATGNPNAAG